MNSFSNADEEVLLQEVKMRLMWSLFIFTLCNLSLSSNSALSVRFLTERTGGGFTVIQREVMLWGTSAQTGHQVQWRCSLTKMKGCSWQLEKNNSGDKKKQTAWKLHDPVCLNTFCLSIFFFFFYGSGCFIKIICSTRNTWFRVFSTSRDMTTLSWDTRIYKICGIPVSKQAATKPADRGQIKVNKWL